jgi:DNA-binding response OmpR family regulator
MDVMKEKRRRILYVEGDLDTAEVFSILLDNVGYSVTTASTLSDGLELAKTREYDLYLLAGILSDAPGLELCRRIREFDRKTPVVFFSSLAFKSDKEAARYAGAKAYLIKPDDIGKIEATLSNLLRPARGNRALQRVE